MYNKKLNTKGKNIYNKKTFIYEHLLMQNVLIDPSTVSTNLSITSCENPYISHLDHWSRKSSIEVKLALCITVHQRHSRRSCWREQDLIWINNSAVVLKVLEIVVIKWVRALRIKIDPRGETSVLRALSLQCLQELRFNARIRLSVVTTKIVQTIGYHSTLNPPEGMSTCTVFMIYNLFRYVVTKYYILQFLL